MKNKGQANLAMQVATLAIVLVVLTVVLGQLMPTLTASVSASTVATAAANNVSSYTWTGITLVSVGMLIVAGMGLIGMIWYRK